VITSRFAPVTAALLALALVPTVIHSYRGLTIEDGLRTAAIPEVLDGAASRPTTRKAAWVESNLAATDWIERTYRVGGDDVRLFAARSYDAKRLYHHPELAVLRGTETVPAGRGILPGRPDVPIQLIQVSRKGRQGIAVYALRYNGRYVENPLLFQVRTAGELLLSGRRAMTLIMASDLSGSMEALEKAPSVQLLRSALEAFEASDAARNR
jgi:hypothetical protein